MAPIEPELSNSNVLALSLLGAYLSGTLSLVIFTTHQAIYKRQQTLPPSQDTRLRMSSRRRNLRLFGALAALSLAQAWYHLSAMAVLSYRVWAYEMGQDVPKQLSLDTVDQLMLGRWLDSTTTTEVWEIVVESSRRYWWTQQLFLAGPAWALFVGIEGRRRRIPHLWAFVLLVPLVSRAFAMNMFFLAVLSSPISPAQKPPKAGAETASTVVKRFPESWRPTLERILPFLPPNPLRPHPASWHPYALSMIVDFSTVVFFTWLLPYTIGTETFSALIAANLIVLFKPIYVDRLAAYAYGSTSMSPIEVSKNYNRVHRFLSISSIVLFVKQTAVALLDNDPGAHYHRHTEYLARLSLPHGPERSPLARSGSAFKTLLGGINDHPATARLGYDVLLCAVSLTAWAIVRGLNVKKIAYSTGLGSLFGIEGSSVLTPPKRRRQPRKRKVSAKDDPKTTNGEDVDYHPDESESKESRGEEQSPENPEAGAVSAVAFIFGGLGLLTSAVLGAEDI